MENLKNRFNSENFINNVCLSYTHDFGLLSQEKQEQIRFECKQWMNSIENNWPYFKDVPSIKDDELRTLIWEDWESEIKESDPREMVFKYMKMIRDNKI